MKYQWNIKKAEANFKRHGVYFADAVSVFFDDYAITIDDDFRGEKRSATLGMDDLGRMLVVVYTWRGDEIRIISARKATPSECKQYEVKS